MDRRDIEEIGRFLASVGQPSLHAYYGVGEDAPPEEIEAAIRKRRSWAQGQQANPKFKAEALFLIKQNGLVRKVLLEEPGTYRDLLGGQETQRNLEALTLFIRGALTAGVLSARAEASIRHQGAQLRLAEAVITTRIEEVLAETGARRSTDDRDDVATTAAAADLYAILEVAPGASQAELEAAYRARYKWARNIADIHRSQDLLKALDDAWRVLKEPERRARYDAERASRAAPSEPRPPEPAAEPPVRPPPLRMDRAEPAPEAVPIPRPEPAVVPLHAEPAVVPLRPEPAVAPRPEPARRPEPPRPEPPRPESAPPPKGITGRTLGLAEGPQAVRQRAPRLTVNVGTLNVRGSGAVRQKVVVRNAGQGPMPGRVVTELPWVEIPVPLLDPGRIEQEVPLVIHADRAGLTGGVGTVTVVADHGERKVIQVVVRRSAPWMWILLGLLALGGLAAAASWWWFSRSALGAAAELHLTVDPRADRVFVDGVERGSGSDVQIRLEGPPEAVLVRVEAEGFRPTELKIDLSPGERYVNDLVLQLADPMDWTPPPTAVQTMLGTIGAEAVKQASSRFDACFPEGPRTFNYTAFVDGTGQVRKVEVSAEGVDLAPVEPCLRRVFRGLRLPAVQSGFGLIRGQVTAGGTRR